MHVGSIGTGDVPDAMPVLVSFVAQAQDSFSDPAGSGALVSAVGWLEGTLLGTIATVVAVIAVKSYSLADVTPVVRAAAERGANVVPLLNGVTAADDLIAGGVPQANVLGGLARISAVRSAPGVVVRRTGSAPVARMSASKPSGARPSTCSSRDAESSFVARPRTMVIRCSS